MNVAYFEEQRREMIAAIRVIAEHLAAEIGKAALDDRVLRAMAKVPRHEFVPLEVQPYAYLNRPLPIGFDKTISQPFMVAVMTDLLELKPDDVVLEIGTGLGYQSAVLAELAGSVYSVEIIDELAQRAVQRLKREGYTNIEVRIGNGYFGWPELLREMELSRAFGDQDKLADTVADLVCHKYALPLLVAEIAHSICGKTRPSRECLAGAHRKSSHPYIDFYAEQSHRLKRSCSGPRPRSGSVRFSRSGRHAR